MCLISVYPVPLCDVLSSDNRMLQIVSQKRGWTNFLNKTQVYSKAHAIKHNCVVLQLASLHSLPGCAADSLGGLGKLLLGFLFPTCGTFISNIGIDFNNIDNLNVKEQVAIFILM